MGGNRANVRHVVVGANHRSSAAATRDRLFVEPERIPALLQRLREDGMIDFCGRRDRMVKIRGQRVEPGDIEYVLRRHDKICNCAVVVRTRQARRESMVALEHSARDSGRSGEQILAAYFTATEAVPTPELRAHLEMHLPVHMVPQRFVQLEELPLNANRKLDVNALPDLDDRPPDEILGYDQHGGFA